MRVRRAGKARPRREEGWDTLSVSEFLGPRTICRSRTKGPQACLHHLTVPSSSTLAYSWAIQHCLSCCNPAALLAAQSLGGWLPVYVPHRTQRTSASLWMLELGEGSQDAQPTVVIDPEG